jgi:succinyl-CoA synthetase beta subunit
MKIDHPSVAHKTELGGVRLAVDGPSELVDHHRELQALLDSLNGAAGPGSVVVQAMAPRGLELILGLRVDPVAGPAVLIGMGGILAELLEDVAVLTPPFTRDDAAAALGGLRAARLFEGVRGAAPVPTEAVVDAMVALGDWALERSEGISVVEVNPLVVAHDGSALAVDALVTVTDEVREPT